MNTGKSIILFSPSKINLFLAIKGKRDDGYHTIHTLLFPIRFGDTLKIELSNTHQDSLCCNEPSLNTNNLIHQALELFRKKHPSLPPVSITLEKKCPIGGGLGGGSSNASTTLLGLNHLLNQPLSQQELLVMATQLGSDCPFFIYKKPMLAQGRGEQLYDLPKNTLSELKDHTLILFKPEFSISTKWAYSVLSNNPQYYSSPHKAEEQINALLLHSPHSKTPLPLYNTFETPIFKKYISLPTLFSILRKKWDLMCLMSGSGSTCFTLIPPDKHYLIQELRQCIHYHLGPNAFFQETSLQFEESV